jgi:hypothetical protein
MNKKICLTMTIAAALLTACNTTDDGPANNDPVEIRLTSAVSTQTRGSYSLDTQIKQNEEIAVYVDEVDETSAGLLYNQVLSAGASGSLTGSTPMYFPQSGKNVDIYAFHTNPTLSGTDYPTVPLTHKVEVDQTDETKYAKSDLLYAVRKGVKKNMSPVSLTFHHLLSKVRIAIAYKSGSVANSLDDATVSIVNTKIEATFTPVKASETFAITPGDAIPDIKIVKIANGDVSANFVANVKYHDAIIVPQTLAENTNFVKVKLTGGANLFFKLSDGANFESGKVYTYLITVDLTPTTPPDDGDGGSGGDSGGIAISSRVTNWVSETKTGDAD